MKILVVASECTPFVKTGGLADVIGTLPNALASGGAEVCVAIPYYRDITQYWKDQTEHVTYFYVNLGWRRQYCGVRTLTRDGVKYYFIDNEFYFGLDNVYGTGQEEGERFGFFCRSVLQMLQELNYRPDLISCHDWQTGILPTLLCTQYQHIPLYQNIKTVYTIHNLHYQGLFAWQYIEDMLGLGEQYFRPDMLEYFGCVSFMKAGVVFSDMVTTVSPTYAQEIQTSYYGERLDGLMRARSNVLKGILNGINPVEYNPENDMWLPAHFGVEDFAGKAACKADLQREIGLNVVADVPIIAIISRLCDQKGLDLIECVLDDIMRMNVQLIVLGKGDEHYQELFSWASWRYQGRVATRIELNNPLSHRIYASVDIMLIPSQFEPCGLTQMIAMRYGTIPVVRETGGLKDSVLPYNKFDDTGNGFSFANYNAHEMLFTIERAVSYYNDKECWERLMRRAMTTDFSWSISAKKYMELFLEVTGIDPLALEGDATDTQKAEKETIPGSAVIMDDPSPQFVEISAEALDNLMNTVSEIAQLAGQQAGDAIEKGIDSVAKTVNKARRSAAKTVEKTADIVEKQLGNASKRNNRAKKLEDAGFTQAAKIVGKRAQEATEKAGEAMQNMQEKLQNVAADTVEKVVKTTRKTAEKLDVIEKKAEHIAQDPAKKNTKTTNKK